ncbi:hypothetical protein [Vagococcus silagei]|uniref:hypothetical protein n=1 Tax=Vagococcus silagei TaxID=2508885 RepID=UPI0013A625D9|nr:hypothetical protein [Vagococcus silagei]
MEKLSEKIKDQILSYREVVKSANLQDQVKENGLTVDPLKRHVDLIDKQNRRKWRSKL